MMQATFASDGVSRNVLAECSRITAMGLVKTPGKPGSLGLLIDEYRK